MDILDQIKKRRSIRRFKQEVLKREDLLTLIEVACFAHSVCNRQSLRYMIVMDREKVKNIFENSSLGLVGQGEEGLTGEDQSPTAYILITAQGSPSHIDYADAGSSFQNMGLVAMQLNLGIFWLHAFASEVLHEALNVPEDQSILSIIAVGRPAETPTAVSIDPEEKEKYNEPGEKNNKVPKLKPKYMVSWR